MVSKLKPKEATKSFQQTLVLRGTMKDAETPGGFGLKACKRGVGKLVCRMPFKHDQSKLVYKRLDDLLQVILLLQDLLHLLLQHASTSMVWIHKKHQVKLCR